MRRHALVPVILLAASIFFVQPARAGGPIASGSTVAGNLTGPGYSETWTFSGTVGDHVLFTAVNTGPLANLNLTLKNPSNSIATSIGGNRLDFQLNASGTWTIVIDDLGSSVATTYSMTLLDLSSTLTSGSDSDGGPIASSQILTGNTNTVSDLDAYTFTGTVGDRVVFNAVPTNSNPYYTLVYLYPPGGGTYVAASSGGRLDYQLLLSGTYTAVVQDQSLAHTGAFSVSLLNVTAGPLTSVSDTDGGAIASGSIKTGTISGPGDLDAFTFSGTVGDHVLLADLTTGGSLNTNVSLYPPGGGPSITVTSADRVDATLTSTGTWTIVLEDYTDTAPGSYSLSLMDLSSTLTSGSDPDGGAIASNQTLSGTTSVVGDFDAYTFGGTIGNRIVMTAISTGGPSYAPVIYLYPPGGATYVAASSSGRLDYPLAASGTYTAVVQDQYLVDAGTYNVSLMNLTAGPTTGGTDTDGGPIASGSIAAGTISGPGDLDVFTFTGTNGDHVILGASTTGGALNTNVSLYPPGGGTALTATSADRVDAQLTSSGTWTVVVEDYNDAAVGTYSLSVIDLSGTVTSPGDADGGVAITSNQILTGTTNDIGDFDVFTFSGTSGQRILMTALPTSGQPYYPAVYLYPPGGGSYVTSTASGRLEYQLAASGTFTAVVQDQNLTRTGTYELSYMNVSAGPFTSVSDTDGGPIVSGSIKSGTISGPGDFDTYTFTGSNGDHVILGAVATGGGLNTNINLYPPGGGAAIVGSSADRQDATLTADGTWTVVVEDISNAASGTYSLSVLDLSSTLTSPGDTDGGWIASNQILSGTTNAVGDMDAFTFNGVSGDRVLLFGLPMTGPPTYRPSVYVYPPGGGSYVTSTTGGRLDYQLTSTGVFTVVMHDQSFLNTGTYALSYLDVSAGYLTSGSDPDGSTIKPGDVKSGQITGPGDFDAYWFTGNSGENAHINLVVTGGALSPYIIVYPPDGSAAVVYTGSLNVSYMLGQTGRYAIVIEDGSDVKTGTYQLSLTGALTTVGVPPAPGPKVLDPARVVFVAPYPNPSRGSQTLTFSLPTAQPVELSVYDTRGALVRTLDRGTKPAGIYAPAWDGLDARGQRVRAGVYFSELRTGGQTLRRALVRLE